MRGKKWLHGLPQCFVLKGSLNTYRFCDNVWTFVLNDVEFREATEFIKLDKVKIVACNGKNTAPVLQNE